MPWEAPASTRCGRIKIGRLGPVRKSKKGTEWQPPVKLDRILITHDHRDQSGNFAVNVDVMTALGAPTHHDVVTEIPIEVHSDDIPDVLACKLVRYVGRKDLACTGDGHTASERTGDGWAERECPCPRSTLVTEGGDCKPNAVFSCSLRLPGHRTIGAVYEFRTTSAISIRRLTGSLMDIKRAVGTLRGLPLTMALREVELTGKSPVYCMHIELREKSVEEATRLALAQAQARDNLLRVSAGQPAAYLALPPGEEATDEAANVVQEFYPETYVEADEVLPCQACGRTQGHDSGCPEAPEETTTT
jgi:hypothetical protein